MAKRWQKIKYDRNGNPYVTYYGRKLPIDLFMMSGDELAYCDTYFSAFILEIDDGGEYASVKYEKVA